MPDERVVVVGIATPLEAELVARVAAVDDRLQVRYEPGLLPPVRFPGDHRGVGVPPHPGAGAPLAGDAGRGGGAVRPARRFPGRTG